ncbi:MAG: NeuD/PglB/VioB family sugar acetyltransferase [Fimbriimonadaceae bacterium]|nr:NeuD/PglB/VioB family sugar acetyltransferase [Fimbriimonadaceae bacterium]QYK59267.1 MAG: NeuD/PglB/VioB family sugar acetyltransferase [Fimbriimonadaceae bacterium]
MIEALRGVGGLEIVGAFDEGGVDQVLGIPVLGPPTPEALREHGAQGFVPAVGSHEVRRRWCEELGRQFALVSAVHPTAFVSPSAEIGLGAFVGPLAVVHTLARIGTGAIVNSGAVVEHDVVVGDYAHVAPGAVLCGGVVVGEGALVGAGARAAPLSRIGTGAVVGAGAVVLKEVPDGERWAGVPARRLQCGKSTDPDEADGRLE